MKQLILLLIGLALGLWIGLTWNKPTQPPNPLKGERRTITQTTDTIRHTDTQASVKATKPIRTDTVRLAVAPRPKSAHNSAPQPPKGGVEDAAEDEGTQSLEEGEEEDSIEVVLPIEQKVYETEDYKAYVSGYDPRLDSLFITRHTVTITERTKAKPKRWSIGVTAGYGYTPRGFQPYIGIGINYDIISF